jgi:hypothetical protein
VVFEILAEARSLKDLRGIESKAWGVYRRCMDELDAVDVRSRLSIAGSVS